MTTFFNRPLRRRLSILEDFTHSVLGNTGLKVHRLGLSATYHPGRKTIHAALEAGINYFFFFGIDGQMIRTLREIIPAQREKIVIATGAYNLLIGHPNLRRTLEKRLRKLRTDYIDIFMFLGVTREKHLSDHIIEEFNRFREEGKVRAIGISTHHRKSAGKLAENGTLDVLMIRYNAAHRGAEVDIFPYVKEHNPGIVSFTATRWRYLIRRPRGYPKNQPVPTAGQCYRFVLSNPHVHVCMTAPTNEKQLSENLRALEDGPLTSDEMNFMGKFGDMIHYRKKP